MNSDQKVDINLDLYDAAILDMDGVITSSARAHAAAWKRMFDEFLQTYSSEHNQTFEPFDDKTDYFEYVDGKPRYEGAQSFLESRGISLPYGTPDDPPDKETVCGLGNRKNQYFLEYLHEHGADPYPSTVDFIKELQQKNIRVAAISSSRNAKAVLESAGVIDFFKVIIDGVYASQHDIQGKPEPDVFLEAARKLDTSPDHAIVVEDAISGVQAGQAGGFALVIGIDRSGDRDLKEHGADIVVNDLAEIRRKSL